jgi:hypothetical protein
MTRRACPRATQYADANGRADSVEPFHSAGVYRNGIDFPHTTPRR